MNTEWQKRHLIGGKAMSMITYSNPRAVSPEGTDEDGASLEGDGQKLWGVDDYGSVYEYDPHTHGWVEDVEKNQERTNWKIDMIAFSEGLEDQMWALSGSQIGRWNADDKKWDFHRELLKKDIPIEMFAFDSTGRIWCVDTCGNICLFNKDPQEWEVKNSFEVNSKVTWIHFHHNDKTDKDEFYCVDEQGNLGKTESPYNRLYDIYECVENGPKVKVICSTIYGSFALDNEGYLWYAEQL